MVQKSFYGDTSIVPILQELEAAESTKRAVNLIHILGDLTIGMNHDGKYPYFAEEIEGRIKVLISYADLSPGQEFKEASPSNDMPVREKALSTLCSIFSSVEKMNRERWGKWEIILGFSRSLLSSLLRFFSCVKNLPKRGHELASIRSFLLVAYRLIRGKDFRYDVGVENINSLYSYSPDIEGNDRLHKAVILPLILVGESELFLWEQDFVAEPYLERYARGYLPEIEGYCKYPTLLEALAHEGRHNHSDKYRAAAACLGLKYLREGQEELPLAGS